MQIKLKESTHTAGKRLDMKLIDGSWSIWDEDTLVERRVEFDIPKEMTLDHYKVIVNDDETSARIVRFADLHRHSDNSLKDGMIKVSDMVKHTEYAGALTDHGVMYGFLEFYKGMKAAGKHPIVGFEAYAEDMDGNLEGNHLLLLAKNNQGYANLLKLTSESYDHFYRHPHVTWEMLEKYHEGVVCTSACVGGVIPKALLNNDRALAEKAVQRYQSIFGADFYLEIQRHGFTEEDIVNPQIIEMAKQFNIPLIATTDSHYLRKEDAAAHEILLCLQYQQTLNEPHATFPGSGYHMHTSEEMEALFADIPEALDNTLKLAEQCQVDIKLGDVNLPNYDLPDGFETPLAYFKHLCEEGFQRRFAGTEHLNDPKYQERYDYEMSVIEEMHFETYFIIVQDFINYARENDIYIGPGRGSAAGSLLAYCLGITDMDPIRFNLLFERFLNPERVSWPDVDTDIEHTGRQKVIDYMTHKYGVENVCRIVTFGTMAARMVLKDVARVMGYPSSWANGLSKLVPSEPGMTLDKAMDMNPELKTRYENEHDVKRVVDVAKALEGCKRHASQHACGLVCAPGRVDNFLPTSMEIDEETKEKSVTAQVVMTEVEELSLLKMDLLGLKNLTAIHEVINNIKKTRGVYTTYQELPLDDRATYQMLAKGLTGGVFQLESEGMTKLIMQMFEDIDTFPDERLGECFERLIAAVALYRPGPRDFIPNYIAGMRNPSNVHYLTPELEDILRPTYGVIVYQEQVMQIVQKLAGYTLGRADVVRRAMSKKKKAVMAAEKQVFIYGNKAAYETGKDKNYAPGCIANGISESIAEQIWDQMDEFAKYAFNKSHAACYAWIASITAYMACHWTPEFYCGMMNAFEDIGDKVKSYLAYASKRGLSILPPHINKSSDKCVVEGEGFRIGLHTLAGVNKLGKEITKEREKGEFEDYQDFYERMRDAGYNPNKTAVESLIYSGAMDCFGYNRKQLITLAKKVEDNYKNDAENRALGQFSMFGEEDTKVKVPKMPEFSDNTLMEEEFKAIGFYLTRHPVDDVYAIIGGDPAFSTISDLAEKTENRNGIVTAGLIRDMRQIFTRKGEEMCVFTIDDRFNSIRCVVFPRRMAANRHRLANGAVVKIVGDFSVEDQGAQIIVQDVTSKEEIPQLHDQTVAVTIRNKDEQERLLHYIEQHPGKTGVQIMANGRPYNLRKRIQLSPEVLDYLTANFSRVVCN